MRCAASLVVLAFLGTALVGCAKPREEAKEGPKTDPMPAPVQPPAPAGDQDKEKKEKAQTQCMKLSDAIEAYMESPQNPARDLTDDQKMPQNIADLYHVPFGGPSFLRNGKADTLDPWGKPFELKMGQRKDGTIFLFVHTHAPDGTPITQFGVGKSNADGGAMVIP